MSYHTHSGRPGLYLERSTMGIDATKSIDEEAQELADADYMTQIGEIANALRVMYERGVQDAITAAIAFTGQSGDDIRKEFEMHYRRHK